MSLLLTLADTLSQNLRRLDSQFPDGTSPHLWDARPCPALDDVRQLPPQEAFDLIDKIRVDLKAVEALIVPSHFRLVELGLLQYKVAALNTVVSLDVANALTELGGHASLHDLAVKVQTNEHKLDLGMRAALGISNDLGLPETRDSFSEKTAPFVKEVSKDGTTFFEYMMNPDNAEMVTLANDGVQLTRCALLTDYPWGDLGDATVIDVGCGAGDSGIDVMKKYPRLKWTFQDFDHVLKTVKENIPDELQQNVNDGSIQFVQQDYFQPNASRGDVWYLRGVLHEYTDEDVVKILTHLAAAMHETPGSRMIINEVFVASPVIMPATSSFSTSAPSDYIPRKQSALADMANAMTWSTFSLFGGKERSYAEYQDLLNQSGLKVSRFYRFRTFTVMLECELA
ncbi:hypothetical protein LTS17_009425 [Exophiala oligosperma]